MEVLKFGGTSVGSSTNIRRVADITITKRPAIIVLSAMSGTTDTLIDFSTALRGGKATDAISLAAGLKAKYAECVEDLLEAEIREKGMRIIRQAFDTIQREMASYGGAHSDRVIVAQGELLTSAIFSLYMRQRGYNAVLLNAPDFVRTDVRGKVDTAYMESKLAELTTSEDVFYITQGFICSDHENRISNLGRGGSDYSAALIGAAVGAGSVQIWTDIDGMHNNDPRYVANTRPIRRMSFDEAAELAYFGAKILHPATIQPCKDRNIPVYLKNTMDPLAEGTVISQDGAEGNNFRAVAAKDGITLVRITSARMLMAYGFLRKVFEVFEQWQTPIDMITTSEVAVSLTIDNDAHLPEIVAGLAPLGSIEVERNNSIVCIVGHLGYGEGELAAKIMTGVGSVPLKMISYGASHRSIALLVDTGHKQQILQNINDSLFNPNHA